MNHYQVLGLTLHATPEEIKAAYRKLRSLHHPDRNGDKAMFDAVQKAFDGLQNKVCPVCEGVGQIKERQGAFVKTVNCPRCWASSSNES